MERGVEFELGVAWVAGCLVDFKGWVGVSRVGNGFGTGLGLGLMICFFFSVSCFFLVLGDLGRRV